MNEPNKKIHAENAQEWMSAHLDGMLNADESAELQAYLDRTPAAKAELDEMNALLGYLGNLPEVAPPADLYARVRAEIETDTADSEKRAFSITPWLRRAAGIAAVLLIARVGYHELQQEKAPRDANTVLRSPETAREDTPLLEKAAEEALLSEAEQLSKEKEAGVEALDRAEALKDISDGEDTPAPVVPAPAPVLVEQAGATAPLPAAESIPMTRIETAKPLADSPAPTASTPPAGIAGKMIAIAEPEPMPGAPEAPDVNGSLAAIPADKDELKSKDSEIGELKSDRFLANTEEGNMRKDLAKKSGQLSKNGYADSLEAGEAGGGFLTDNKENAPASLDAVVEVQVETTATPAGGIVEVTGASRISGERLRESDGAIWRENAAEPLRDEAAHDDTIATVTESPKALPDSGSVEDRSYSAPSESVATEPETRHAEIAVARRTQETVAPIPHAAPNEGAKAPAVTAPGQARPAMDESIARQMLGSGSGGNASGADLVFKYESQDASNTSLAATLHPAGYASERGALSNESPRDTAADDTLTLIGSDKDARPMRVQASIADVDTLIARFSSTAKQKRQTPDTDDSRSSALAAFQDDAKSSPSPTGATSGPHAAGKILRVFKIDRADYDAFVAALEKIGKIEAKPAEQDPKSGWFLFKKSSAGTIMIYLMVEPPAAPESDPKSE